MAMNINMIWQEYYRWTWILARRKYTWITYRSPLQLFYQYIRGSFKIYIDNVAVGRITFKKKSNLTHFKIWKPVFNRQGMFHLIWLFRSTPTSKYNVTEGCFLLQNSFKIKIQPQRSRPFIHKQRNIPLFKIISDSSLIWKFSLCYPKPIGCSVIFCDVIFLLHQRVPPSVL